MGREDDEAAIGGLLVDHFEDAELARQVEAGDRFVEQQHVGLGGDRLCHEDALLLAAGQVPERAATEVADFESLRGGVDQFPIVPAEPTEETELLVAPHPKHLIDREGHPAVVIVVLGHHGNGAADSDAPVFGCDQTGEQREQGGLAAAVRSDQRNGCAALELERGRSEGNRAPVVDAGVFGDGQRPDGRLGSGNGSSCHENGSHSSIMRMIPNRNAVLAVGGLVTLAACGGSAATSGATDGAPIATTTIWADITSEVACGAPVAAIIPPGADPHAFEISLRDRETVENSSVIVANGGGLEASMTDLLGVVAASGTDVVEMTTRVDLILHDEEEATGPDATDDGHGHDAEGDPHVWQDPLRVAGALDLIDTALRAHDIPTCTGFYRDELLALDAEIKSMIDVIPPDHRVMVTSHDSLAYFADRYGLTVVGTVIPSTNTLAQTNAADLAALADLIEELQVPAIFTEQLESTGDAESLARRLDVAIVPLVTDSLTDALDSDTYIEMMRSNATAIATALAP